MPKVIAKKSTTSEIIAGVDEVTLGYAVSDGDEDFDDEDFDDEDFDDDNEDDEDFDEDLDEGCGWRTSI